MKALPKVRFDMMNTVNTSTQVSLFVLKTGRSPQIIPLLIAADTEGRTEDRDESERVKDLVDSSNSKVEGAKDCLLVAKISQAHHTNKVHGLDPEFKIGEKVMLEMAHRRRDYMQKKSGRVAKFMPHWDRPYKVMEVFPSSSTYRLAIPNSGMQCTTFHVSHLKEHMENDNELFPGRKMERPGPIVTEEGTTEYFVEKILDERPRGRGKQYLVCWKGYGPEADLWQPRSEMLDTEVLVKWEGRAQ